MKSKSSRRPVKALDSTRTKRSARTKGKKTSANHPESRNVKRKADEAKAKLPQPPGWMRINLVKPSTKTPKIAIILGAGASVDYGLPTLFSLSGVVAEFVRNTKSPYWKVVFERTVEITQSLWGIDPSCDWINYESVLGALDYLVRIDGALGKR